MTGGSSAGDPPDVSILIVAFNSAALIGDCLGSIPAAARHCRCEVLLIDNGDGSTQALVEQQFAWVRLVPGRGNIGFAAGNNVLAGAASAPMLLLLNPDMVLEPGSIDALLAGARCHPEAAAWGGVTTDAHGCPDSGNAIPVPSLLELASSALGRSLTGSRPLAGVERDARVKVLSGGFVMFARAAWDEAKGLDERYFLYCEEVDLFHRLARRGHVFWRIAAARGYHNAGHGDGMSARRLVFWAAGTMQFVRLHWSRPGAGVAALLVWLGAFERYLAGRLLGRWSPRLKRLGASHRTVALQPWLWRYGYDPRRGLLVQLGKPQGGTA